MDNIYVATNSIIRVDWFKLSFKRLFKVKDLEKIEKILSIKIIRNRSKRIIRID